MSKKVTGDSEKSSQDTVALIADAAARDEILPVLQAQDLKVEAFSDLADLQDESATGDPCAIVLWTDDDTVASLSKPIEHLTRHFSLSPLVVVCSSIHRWEVRTALAAGAAGVVAHENLTATLGPCLLAVRAGQTCVPREQWRQIDPPALSSREKQILGLVVMGYMNSQIAERLFLAESTVKSHLSSAFGKLGVRSRNEAVNLIIDPERGLGMGILTLGGEPLETISTGAG